MLRRLREVGLLLLVAAWAATAAVAGQEGTWPACQFPDGALPVIDGDLADWAVLGSQCVVTEADLTDLVGGSAPVVTDFAVRLQLAWAAASNSLYIGARVFDDVHQVDRPAGTAATRIWQDDALEIFVDADHSGGQYADFADLDPAAALLRNGAQASHFVVAGPHPDGEHFVNFSAAGWYALAAGPYTEAAVVHDAGRRATVYEVRLVPFDHVDVRAVFLSDMHVLAAGQVIGFNVELSDFDASPELYEAKWSLSGQHNAFRHADRFADLMLVPLEGILPSSVDRVSWGQAKDRSRAGRAGWSTSGAPAPKARGRRAESP